MNITFIDHYDSFSFNVLDWLQRAGDTRLKISRLTCDDHRGLDNLSKNLTPIVISPGPGKPEDYPMTMSLIKQAIPLVPVLGICLGHQMIGQIAGGRIIKGRNTWHGTLGQIEITKQNWVTSGLTEQFKAVMYNSLVVDMSDADDSQWLVLARDNYGQVMILSHKNADVASVQFHPESFASDDLTALAKNFFRRIK